MGADSKIQWTDHTFNPWIGCTKVSPACDHCYAEAGSRRLGAQHGLKLWNGDRFFTGAAYWMQPARWDRAAARDGVRRRVFCASFADVFEDLRELVETRERLWEVIRATPHLDWLMLTKRPQNLALMVPWDETPWPNVWLGTTCEDQAHADLRIPELLKVPAAVRFVSYEPALGPVDFTRVRMASGLVAIDVLRGLGPSNIVPRGRTGALDWIIVGGESGPGARIFDVAWARDTVAACRAAGVAVFVKQLGAVPRDVAAREDWEMQDRKGGDWSEWPDGLRVREFPRARDGIGNTRDRAGQAVSA